MATPAQLRRDEAKLTRLAANELAAMWRQVQNFAEAGQLLHDVLPGLISTYGEAMAAVAAEWYDEARVAADVGGRYRALPAALGDAGAASLAGWASAKGATLDSILELATGGLTKRVMTFSRETIMSSSLDDPRAQGWQRVGAGECDFCLMLISRGAVYTESSADFGAHDNCFPGEVTVFGPSAEIGYRRWFEGELVIIGTADGEQLPVTPNHPILTPQGWVAAGDLRVGQNVFQCTNADLAALSIPHENDVPSPIEDVWRSLSMNRLRSVPVSAEDFHGDIGTKQGNVDVVAANGFLADMGHASRFELMTQVVGARTGSAAILNSFTTGGDRLLPLFTAPRLANSGVRGSSVGLSLFRSHSLCANHSRLARGANLNPNLGEPSSDHTARNAVAAGHRQSTLSGLVNGADVIRDGFDPIMSSGLVPSSAGLNTPTNQGFANAFTALSSKSASNLIERLSGGVKLLRIVELGRRKSAGHVYNLQTVEGWYSANGLIVHNCRCSAVPAFDGAPREVLPYTPSLRQSDADAERAKAWIADHL